MFPLRRALFALAISMAVPVCAAQAATFVVDRTDDSNASACSSAANDCTLRGAIINANAIPGAHIITFDGISGSTIILSQGEIMISARALSIQATSRPIMIRGDQVNRTFNVQSSSGLTLTNLEFIYGVTSGDGGAILNNGNLKLNACQFRYNRGFKGGAVSNLGQLQISNSIFEANTGTEGGAIFSGTGMSAAGSSFSSNTANNRGGAICLALQAAFDEGAVSLHNSTIYNNTAQNSGGGVYNDRGATNFDSCTISNNGAPFDKGSGIAANGVGTRNLLKNTIVATNAVRYGSAANDVSFIGGTNTFVSLGNNLLGSGNARGAFNMASDLLDTDPKLGNFSEANSSTGVQPLLEGSPALDRGKTSLATDQRGRPRPQGSGTDIGAYESDLVVIVTPPNETPSLIVTTLADVAADDGQTSLREAIDYSNIKAGADTISFAANVRGTLQLNGTQLPLVRQQLIINGPRTSELTLDAAFRSRFFTVSLDGNLTLNRLSLTRGTGSGGNISGGGALQNEGTLVLKQMNVSGNGNNISTGGAISSSGTLTIQDSVLNNNACYNNGGAVFNSGTLQILRSTFNGNRSLITSGGALYNGGSATIVDSTFSGNSAQGNFSGSSSSTSALGGAILSVGELNLRNCTLSGNSIATRTNGLFCGGAICISRGSFSLESCTLTDNFAGAGKGAGIAINGSGTIRNTIIAGNRGSDVDGSAAFTSGGNNLIGGGGASARFNATGDQVGVSDARLGPLANNGGPTQTHALLTNSPAIDQGNTTLATDQRGIARPQGGVADIGAFEMQAATPPSSETPSLIVTTLADVTADDGQTSLREAINYANSKPGADAISFAGHVHGKIAVTSPLPPITDGLSINGPGAPLLAIDGGGKVRLFRIAKGVTADINYLTLSGARYDPDKGPEGALLNEGNLILRQLAMTNNIGIEGGALTNMKGSVSLFGCQISGNTALNGGGGLLNNDGTLIVFNSTIANNVAIGNVANASGGGGVSTFGSKAYTTLEYVTMTGNRAPNVAGNTRAGVWVESGLFAPHNSIFYGNGARDLQIDGGTLSSGGYSIIGKTNRKASFSSTDRFGINPKLGALTDNGGSTRTQALWPGSPAINTGDPAYGNGTDQRGGGFLRLRGGRLDVGAFEVQSDLSKTAPSAKAPASASVPVPRSAPSGGRS